jgi:hypothetical protein
VYLHGRTHVGSISKSGDVQVSTYDHESGVTATSVVCERFPVDDHNSPAILVRPDRHLWVFWSGHGGNTMYYRRSLRPEDASGWEPTRTVATNTAGPFGYTYPNPVQLSAEADRLYLFWRGGNYQPTFSATDDGQRWTPARSLVAVPGQRPYLKVACDDRDTVHFAFTQAHPRDVVTSIYYMYYRDGVLFRAGGERIGPLRDVPVTPQQASVVHDARRTGIGAWIHDIAIDGAGRPVLTYATFPRRDDHRYQYARWSGSGWQVTELAAAGPSISGDPVEYQYSGGIVLNHADPSIVYLSRAVDGVPEIERWLTADGGRSWTHAAITTGSAQPNMRPVSPRGTSADSPAGVVWMAGHYGTYTTFQSRIMRGTGV